MNARSADRHTTAQARAPAPILAAAILLLSACATPGPGDGDATCPSTQGQEILERINEIRAGAGLEPLAVDLRLVRAARAHSESMLEHDFFGHVGPDGVEPADRVAATGYEWTFVAENLAAGELTPTRVVAGWLESPLHRDNILEPASAHVGIAHAAGDGIQYQKFWTAIFADTDGEVEAPEGGCHP